jgi:hypothetical protein
LSSTKEKRKFDYECLETLEQSPFVSHHWQTQAFPVKLQLGDLEEDLDNLLLSGALLLAQERAGHTCSHTVQAEMQVL